MGVERREQVFVSSTYVDLQLERQEAIRTLLEADCIPAGMELFPATDDDKWSLIQRVIDDSDYYVVIVGGRYGSVDPEKNVSYTEMEYDYAVATNTPVMGFLHGSPGLIPADKTELDPDRRQRLDEFRSKVEERPVKYWQTPSELAGQLALSLIQLRKSHPAEGWIRARDAVTPELQTEMADMRATIAEQRARIDELTSVGPAGTEGLAQGDDLCSLSIHLSYWSEGSVEAGAKYRYNRISAVVSAELSWDAVLASIGPTLIDEATDAQIRTVLATDAYVGAENLKLPEDFGELSDVPSLTDRSLDDVKVQLYALNLIQKSQRRRTVKDTNTYWCLTPLGEDHLMRLRAIRKDPEA